MLHVSGFDEHTLRHSTRQGTDCGWATLVPALMVGFVALMGRSEAQTPSRPTGSVTPVAVTFMSRGLEWFGENKSATGHAFMVITITTSKGTVSDAYGFYPATGGKGVIKGPGMLKSEFRCSKEECLALSASAQDVRDSVTVPATEDERVAIQQLISEYNGHTLWGTQPAPGYTLVAENCNAFVGRVAEALGYPAPSPTTLPTRYLDQLRGLVKVEQERRALERERQLRQEAERKAERLRQERLEEERRKREAERKRREEEQRRREAERNRRPPSGWTRCQCPQAHTQHGEIFNGERWHPPGLACP